MMPVAADRVEVLERKIKRYRATLNKQTFQASIPPPSGERSKPGGFQLQAAMHLGANKAKYNTIMVRGIAAMRDDANLELQPARRPEVH